MPIVVIASILLAAPFHHAVSLVIQCSDIAVDVYWGSVCGL